MTGCHCHGYLAAILVALPVPAALSQATVALRVDSQQAYVNEPTRVEIEIDGFSACEEPVFPDIPGCAVHSLGATRQGTVIENRRQSHSRTYSFQLVPTTPGRLVIPEIEVSVDGEKLRTRPVVLAVNPSNVEELLTVTVNCDTPRVYVGQRIRLTLTLWLKAANAGGRPLSGREMFQFIERDGFGPFPLPQRVVERAAGPAGDSGTYYTYDTTAEVVANQPGPLTLDNVGIVVNYPKRFGRDFWGDLTVTGYRRLFGRPQVAAVEVLPLPAEGRPAGFSGAVGRFEIAVSAKPTTVRVGDPIELTIDLRGDGELETLAAPRLAENAALTSGFRVPNETLAGETRDGRRRFTETIRAARPDVREIPAIELPYFDPERGEYRVARSQPIPIRVEAADKLDAGALRTIVPPTERERSAALTPLDGLRGNETDPAKLLASVARPSVEAVLAAAAAPPAMFLAGWACIGVARRRAGDAARQRRLGAARRARERIHASRTLAAREQAAAVSAALASYLADRLDEPPARFVGRAAGAALRARAGEAELAARWDRLLERCEALSFGAGASSGADGPDTLGTEAQACIEAVERIRL